jgi:anti-sigma regulatory factor (Ser/Thr protein kinase)
MEVNCIGGAAVVLRLDDGSQVGEVRRTSVALAAELGFSEADRGRIALVMTEAARNTVAHGGGGRLLLRAISAEGKTGIEALFQDKGPGIQDVEVAFRDGHSTAGTPGTGLGAIARQSDFFDLYSAPGLGTVLLTRFTARTGRDGKPDSALRGDRSGPPLELAGLCIPRPGETACGDACAVARHGSREFLMMADGLGHGPLAEAASTEAVRVFRQTLALHPGEILSEMHAALRSTRGATVAVAELDPDARQIHYVGVGNIAGYIVTDGTTRSMVSHNGTVGHQLHKIQEFTYPWPAGALVLLHSDGLQTHWQLERYPGLGRRHPSIIAGILDRDYARGRDDVGILVARERE